MSKLRSSIGRYGIVPFSIFEILHGEPTSIAVYALLATHANRGGECDPHQDSLARELGLSTRTMRRALDHLARVGLLAKSANRVGNMKRGNVYELVIPHSATGVPLERSHSDTHVLCTPDTDGRSESPIPSLLEQSKDEHVIAPALASLNPTRRRDEMWDALMSACGIDGDITPGARGAYNKAVAELRGIGANPSEILERAEVYRAKWPGTSCTPSALTRHWAECAPARWVAAESESVRNLRQIQRLRDEGRIT